MSYFVKNEHSYVRLLAADGTAITETAGALDVNLVNSISVDLSANGDSVQIYGANGGVKYPVLTDTAGRIAVDATLQISDVDLLLGPAVKATCLTVVLATDHPDVSVTVRTMPTVGTHGNLWNGASPLLGTDSTAIDCQWVKSLDIFGQNTTGTGNLEVHVSQDNVIFYDTGHRIVTIDATPFFGHFDLGARYVRMRTDVGQTGLTATLAGKN